MVKENKTPEWIIILNKIEEEAKRQIEIEQKQVVQKYFKKEFIKS